MIPINRTPTAGMLRQFTAIVLPIFVVLVGGLIWWRSGSIVNAAIVWGVGGLIVAAAMASRELARQLFVGLQVVTYPVGLVVSMVVLASLFYLVFTPLAAVMRLAGRDALRLRARQAASHWVPYKQRDDPADAFRQY
jgi:hypothetical protein